MSSDSEDDCYGNIAQKLQLMKVKYSDDNLQSSNLLDNLQLDSCELIKDDSDCEEMSLDAIIAAYLNKKATQTTERFVDDERFFAENIVSKTSEKADNSTPTINLDVSDKNTSSIEKNKNVIARSRGRGRKSADGRGGGKLLYTLPNLRGSNPLSYPSYNVGNTSEYTDKSYNQPLFLNQTTKNNDLNDSLDENEELSVKVYWQSSEYVRFTIRRFQTLQLIFDFFSEREKVSQDKLLFIYNDRILKQDDSPDSITYSIIKFIDGGIIKQSVSTILCRKDGIKLKFQCENVKKRFECYVKPEEKLAVAMIRCAEHFDKPLRKLKFIFDGDIITGKSTPRELELEGGDCLDVKIIT